MRQMMLRPAAIAIQKVPDGLRTACKRIVSLSSCHICLSNKLIIILKIITLAVNQGTVL